MLAQNRTGARLLKRFYPLLLNPEFTCSVLSQPAEMTMLGSAGLYFTEKTRFVCPVSWE